MTSNRKPRRCEDSTLSWNSFIYLSDMGIRGVCLNSSTGLHYIYMIKPYILHESMRMFILDRSRHGQIQWVALQDVFHILLIIDSVHGYSIVLHHRALHQEIFQRALQSTTIHILCNTQILHWFPLILLIWWLFIQLEQIKHVHRDCSLQTKSLIIWSYFSSFFFS